MYIIFILFYSILFVCVCVIVCVCGWVDMHIYDVLCCLLVCMPPLTHVVISTRGLTPNLVFLLHLFMVCTLYDMVKELSMHEGKFNNFKFVNIENKYET